MTIKNAGSDPTDVVIVGDSSVLTDVISFHDDRSVDDIPLLQGEAVTLDAYSTTWRVLHHSQMPHMLYQATTPVEIHPAQKLVEVIAGTDYLSLPDPTLFPFTIDQLVKVKNSRSTTLHLISHHALTGYTITMVDLGSGLFGVTSSLGSSSSFSFLDQTWTSMHCDSADDTFHFVMPSQPTTGGNAVPLVKVFISDLMGVRNFRYFSWSTDRFTGEWPGLTEAVNDSAWPNAISIWPVGVPGGNTTIRQDAATTVGDHALSSGATIQLLLDGTNDLWHVFS
jgi:hypothetical protein